MQGPASLALCLTLLIAVTATQPGLKVGQESLPAKVVQLFTIPEKLADNGDEENEEEGSVIIGQEGSGKRSFGVNIPKAVIMRSLKRSSSSAMPGMSARLDVQQQAMLRCLLHFALERHLGYLIQMQMLRCHSSHTFI